MSERFSDEVLQEAAEAYMHDNGPGAMWPSQRSALAAMRAVLEGHLAEQPAMSASKWWRAALGCNNEMVDYIRLAASLRGMNIRDYVREAINRQLCKEGVDAMLLPEADGSPR